MTTNDQHTAPSTPLPVAEPEPEETTVPAPPERGVTRRAFLRIGALGTATAGFYAARSILAPSLQQRGLWTPDGILGAASTAYADQIYIEVFPTSPLILDPFKEPLPIPQPLRPLSGPTALTPPPGPGPGQQNSFRNETHQLWPTDARVRYPEPIIYRIKLQVGAHQFTTSDVLAIDKDGKPAVSFDANGHAVAAGTRRKLPPSTIYGFNGTFPGPMINAEYGFPALVRFENHLDENPLHLDRQDYGSPDLYFLTHLHNGHTAAESDGNPHYSMVAGPRLPGYPPHSFVDNLYLNWPAGSVPGRDDETEKQSFFWFHDHVMDHTGADVYKGMVGIYPLYDPKIDNGDERNPRGLRLPGRRRNLTTPHHFKVDYDIPLVLFDCRLDDGVTVHQDFHDTQGSYPAAGNPRTHPEWWGKTFYKHFPNHGFVGDIFTVNGKAFPVMEVERRKYRFRFLDASVARIYELQMMSSARGPKSAVSLGLNGDELQGQYRIPDGQQSMRFTEIATDGGLLPFAITRNSFELWPAKRREVIIDFGHYKDGTTTSLGDVVYLTNVMKMPTGRMWSNSTRFSPDPNYKVPLVKFVIRRDPAEPDQSVIPPANKPLRPLPALPSNWRNLLSNRHIFEVQRGSAGGELEWLINGKPFDPNNVLNSLKNPAGRTPAASMPEGSEALWELRNGGGGWVHPVHLHQEEHRTVIRNGRDVSGTPDAGHPDDKSREDLAALDPSESVIVFRRFRDFHGPYVAHCHNLTHEDHAMMFAWEIR